MSSAHELAYSKRYYEEHKEEIKEKARAYYQLNREKAIAAAQSWQRANKDKVRERNRRWFASRPGYSKNRWREIRAEVLHAYGDKCACCGESQPEFLGIDHIHGGGNQHRKTVTGRGGRFYYWLKQNGFPKDEFRLLCHNCNLSLGNYGYCPHAEANELAS